MKEYKRLTRQVFSKLKIDNKKPIHFGVVEIEHIATCIGLMISESVENDYVSPNFSCQIKIEPNIKSRDTLDIYLYCGG